MGQTILQHGGRFVIWSSNVDDVVTPPMGEAAIRILYANGGWSEDRLDDEIKRARRTGISSRMTRDLEEHIRERIGIVEDMNADLRPGEEPLSVPTREELLARWFAEDGGREGAVLPTEDGLDLVVRTADPGGDDVRDVVIGLRGGEIAIVGRDNGMAQGLTVDAAGLDALIHALTRLRPAVAQGEELRRAFLRIVEDDVNATIESDVDGIKGTFGLVDGAVVRLIGDRMTIPFPGKVDDILKIEDDGAYSVGRR